MWNFINLSYFWIWGPQYTRSPGAPWCHDRGLRESTVLGPNFRNGGFDEFTPNHWGSQITQKPYFQQLVCVCVSYQHNSKTNYNGNFRLLQKLQILHVYHMYILLETFIKIRQILYVQGFIKEFGHTASYRRNFSKLGFISVMNYSFARFFFSIFPKCMIIFASETDKIYALFMACCRNAGFSLVQFPKCVIF